MYNVYTYIYKYLLMIVIIISVVVPPLFWAAPLWKFQVPELNPAKLGRLQAAPAPYNKICNFFWKVDYII